MVLHRRARTRRAGAVVRYRGQRRGAIFGKVLKWIINIGKKAGTEIAKKAGTVTKATVQKMVKDAGKKIAKKVTDPETLKKLAKAGAQAGVQYVGGKLLDKKTAKEHAESMGRLGKSMGQDIIKGRPKKIRRIVIRKR